MLSFKNRFNKKILVILFIECPVSEDGMERFACPTADRMGRFHCIDDHVLCDGFLDCPTGEDEDRQACLFYKTVSRIITILYFISYFLCTHEKFQLLNFSSFRKNKLIKMFATFLSLMFYSCLHLKHVFIM